MTETMNSNIHNSNTHNDANTIVELKNVYDKRTKRIHRIARVRKCDIGFFVPLTNE